MNIHDTIIIQGRMFQVLRKFPEHQINLNKGDVSDLKDFFHCDTIFKAKGHFWMCSKIQDINYEKV